MTHFTVGLIIPQDKLPLIHDFITDQMAPFDEGIRVARYVSYSVEQAKAELEQDILRLERIVERRDAKYNLEKCCEVLIELRATTPMQRYREYLQHHESFNAKGEPVSTYNPNSKWDWWIIGGRWDGWINDKETRGNRVTDNVATTEEAVERGKFPHAIITPDGQWHERGKMGWWAILITENDDWASEAKQILASYPGHQFLILDAHI